MGSSRMIVLDISRQTLRAYDCVYNANNISQIALSTQGSTPETIQRKQLEDLLQRWFDKSETLEVYTSGSTGTPKRIRVEKERMMASALRTCNYLQIAPHTPTLLAMDIHHIGAIMQVVRCLVWGLPLLPIPPSGHPLATFSSKDILPGFVSLVPLQIYNSLSVNQEREVLKHINTVLIGGAALDPKIESELQSFPNKLYATYGMTETLSHIALRRINGANPEPYFTPMEGVQISSSSRGTLNIYAPHLSPTLLETEDLVEIDPQGHFIVLGRSHNSINSGGIKLQIEQIEQAIAPFVEVPYAITSLPDVKFGEIVTLLLEMPQEENAYIANLRTQLQQHLPQYHAPQVILFVNQIPTTSNGKIDRVACKALAQTTYQN